MLQEIREIEARKDFDTFGVTIWDDSDFCPTDTWYEYICPDCGKRNMKLLEDGIYCQCACGREFEKERVLINY